MPSASGPGCCLPPRPAGASYRAPGGAKIRRRRRRGLRRLLFLAGHAEGAQQGADGGGLESRRRLLFPPRTTTPTVSASSDRTGATIFLTAVCIEKLSCPAFTKPIVTAALPAAGKCVDRGALFSARRRQASAARTSPKGSWCQSSSPGLSGMSTSRCPSRLICPSVGRLELREMLIFWASGSRPVMGNGLTYIDQTPMISRRLSRAGYGLPPHSPAGRHPSS